MSEVRETGLSRKSLEKKGFDKKFSRRKLLSHMAKGAIGVLAVRGGLQTKDEATIKAQEARKALANFLDDQNKKNIAEVTTPVREPTFLNAVYPDLSSEEMASAKKEAFETEKTFLDYDAIYNTAKYESLIRKSAEKEGIPEELLLGLVVYESKGNPKAVSSAGAKGLTAMMDEMAQRNGLKIGNGEDDERFDPDKILPATARQLREEYERFGNWGLAFQAWHLGDKQLYGLLRIHFASAYGENLPDIMVRAVDDSEEAKAAANLEAEKIKAQYKDKIREHKVTVYHLFKNPKIQEETASDNWESTGDYLPRIIGSAAMFEGNKMLVRS